MQSTKRANYGIDAPLTIINLFIFSAIQTTFAILSHKYLKTYPPVVYWISILLNATGALYCFSTAIFILISSKFLKRKLIKKVIDSLSLRGNERVLDVGCGSGLFGIQIAKRLKEGKVTGIDIWGTQDQSANRKETAIANATLEAVLEKIEFVQADMRELPLADQSVDLIVSCLALHNLEKQEERNSSLCEIYRVLKPQGTLVLIDMLFTKHYAKFLIELGLTSVTLSPLNFGIIPPVRIVKGIKP